MRRAATSSGAEGPDKPSATPVGLDTKDPEVQLSANGSERSVSLRAAGSDDRAGTRPGLGEKPHQGESGGVGEGYASQEPPGGWTPLGQVLR